MCNMHRAKISEILKVACAAPVGLHGGELRFLPTFCEAYCVSLQRPDHTQNSQFTSYLVSRCQLRFDSAAAVSSGWMSSGVAALPQRQPVAPAFSARQRRGYSGTGSSSAVDEFSLIAPDVGLVRIDGVDASGFIVNDVQVDEAILACGDLWLLWKVRNLEDVTIDSISGLLDLVKPPPDILVLGCGKGIRQLPAVLSSALWDRGVAVEALDTVNAVATFNILNQEGRKVVGALLPAGTE